MMQKHSQATTTAMRRRRNQYLRWTIYAVVLLSYKQWLLPLTSPSLSSVSLASFNADLRQMVAVAATGSGISSSSTSSSSPKPLTQLQTQQPRLFVHIGKAGGTSIQLMVQKSTAKCQELRDGGTESAANAKNNDNGDGKDDENNDDNDDDIQAQTCAIAKIAPKRVHLKDGQDKYSLYKQFLVNVRNPIDRLISWYNYELQSFSKEPRWQQGGAASSNFQKLKDCFPEGIGQIVEEGLLLPAATSSSVNTTSSVADGSAATTATSSSSSTECRQLAKDCLKGDIMCFGHNFYNYEVYGEDLLRWKMGLGATALKEDIRVDVIRAEYSMEDFERIVDLWTQPIMRTDEEIQQKPYQLTGFVRGLYGKVRTIEQYQAPKNAKAKRTEINKEVSQPAVTALCRWICVELKTYKHLLKFADNLSVQEKQQSFDELDERCEFNVDNECGTQWEYRNIKQHKKVFEMPW